MRRNEEVREMVTSRRVLAGGEMERKAAYGIRLTLLLMAVSRSVFNFYMVKTTLGTVYVRAEGSVDPLAASIQQGDVFTVLLRTFLVRL